MLSTLLAIFLFLLAVIDFLFAQYGITLFTTERMALVGGAVGLLILPYAQKFKGLGIEWERVISTKEDKD